MAGDVRVVLTPQIKNLMKTKDFCKQESLRKQVKDFIEEKDGDIQTLPVRILLELHKTLKENEGKSCPYLHELLQGSRIYYEAPKEPERNPELVKRLARLKAEQEQREYNAMVKNVTKKTNTGFAEEFGTAVRTTSQEMMTITNFVVTVAGCFAFAYFASQYAWSDKGLRVIFAVITASIVAIAELYFLARTEI